MTIKDFEKRFKKVVEAYDDKDLAYHYNRLWVFNGLPSATFPAVVLERQPRLDWNGIQQNLLPATERFTFKVMFFDNYWHDERDTVSFSAKQESLMLIARQIFGELSRLDREDGHEMNFSYKGNFLGDIDTNNNELMELSCECSVELKVSCDKVKFVYE